MRKVLADHEEKNAHSWHLSAPNASPTPRKLITSENADADCEKWVKKAAVDKMRLCDVGWNVIKVGPFSAGVGPCVCLTIADFHFSMLVISVAIGSGDGVKKTMVMIRFHYLLIGFGVDI
ncbi:hypothetical protein CDAR_544351 [Caerostris darwini]|uniref:Uncharacterized protein n=1 Tax=Caerostris darwini TaxID=1538125 RepID=A0AAV4R9I1_9ARAC|nr:hypothetical protein CDAR_544351 [Caerostris darwini]